MTMGVGPLAYLFYLKGIYMIPPSPTSAFLIAGLWQDVICYLLKPLLTKRTSMLSRAAAGPQHRPGERNIRAETNPRNEKKPQLIPSKT